MTDTPDLIERAAAALNSITPGAWDARYFDGDLMGNGPSSRANARFCADAPGLIRELVDALRAAGVAR